MKLTGLLSSRQIVRNRCSFLSCYVKASTLGSSQRQGDGSAALRGLGVQGTGKGWDHFVWGRGDERGSGAGYLSIAGIV